MERSCRADTPTRTILMSRGYVGGGGIIIILLFDLAQKNSIRSLFEFLIDSVCQCDTFKVSMICNSILAGQRKLSSTAPEPSGCFRAFFLSCCVYQIRRGSSSLPIFLYIAGILPLPGLSTMTSPLFLILLMTEWKLFLETVFSGCC